MNINLAGASNAGKVRPHNEDAWGLASSRPCCVVADGMGGLSRGELASQVVVDTLIQAFNTGLSAEHGMKAAHQKICALSVSLGQERMGSTAVALVIEGDRAIVSWVGDSRAYLWREGSLQLLTKDHSFVNDLIAAGAISADEADAHPNRHVLTRAIGVRDSATIEVDQLQCTLRAGDMVLLSTDGLHGYLRHDQICSCLSNEIDPDKIVKRLIQATLTTTEAGDNITVICASVEK